MTTLLGFAGLIVCLIGLVITAVYWTIKLSHVIPHIDQSTDSRDFIHDFRLFPWTKP